MAAAAAAQTTTVAKKKALTERMRERGPPHLRLDRRRAGRYAAPITDAPYAQDGPVKANASNTRAPGRRRAHWAPEEFEFEVWQEFNINEAICQRFLDMFVDGLRLCHPVTVL